MLYKWSDIRMCRKKKQETKLKTSLLSWCVLPAAGFQQWTQTGKQCICFIVVQLKRIFLIEYTVYTVHSILASSLNLTLRYRDYFRKYEKNPLSCCEIIHASTLLTFSMKCKSLPCRVQCIRNQTHPAEQTCVFITSTWLLFFSLDQMWHAEWQRTHTAISFTDSYFKYRVIQNIWWMELGN